MNISNRVKRISNSPIRKLVPYANAAKRAGKNVYHLNIGQPDIFTPEYFMEAIKNYDTKVVSYGDSKGDTKLIEAICKYYNQYGADYSPEHVYITNGGSEALQLAVQATCDPGDEVLLFEPFYANYSTFILQCNARVVTIGTKVENGYHLPPKDVVERHITSNTTAIIITNPGNPTGVVLTSEEMRMICDLAVKYDLAVIVDEVYREFSYDGKFKSFSSMPELEDNLIMVDSVSKRFSACGARIGCLISKNKIFNQQIMKLCQARLCCPTLEMVGAAALYSTGLEYFEEMKTEYLKRRDTLVECLGLVPDVKFSIPQGAFYMMVKLPVDDAEKFAIWLLQDFDVNGETVMFAPGNGFYGNPKFGQQEARLAYVINSEDIKKAIYILGEGLKNYPGRIK